MSTLKEMFAESMADYIETHQDYDSLSKRDVVVEVIRLLVDDIGAAQQFLFVIGVNVDLYNQPVKPADTAAILDHANRELRLGNARKAVEIIFVWGERREHLLAGTETWEQQGL